MKFHAWRVAGLLFGTATLLTAGDFVAPAEGPVPFRRDKVPLDAETMGNLSRQLGSLAAGLDITTAAGRRTASQMLALATALDPSNTAARELIADLQNGAHHPESDPAETEKFHARIWQYIGWLETPEAGEQGKALAACLADVIAFSDPNNSRAEAIRTAGEHGAWAGWVPTVSEFDPKAEVEAGPAVEKAAPRAPEILLTKAQVRTPIWQRVGKEGTNEQPKWMLSSAPLQMSAHKTTEEPTEFTVDIRASPDGGNLQQLGNTIKTLLKKQHEKLPFGWNVLITSNELQKSAASGKRQSISGAAAVLASAAITGQEPDATIIGVVDAQGAFKLSSGFWDQVDSLGKGNGGRLVVPAAAAEYLPAMLALEKPQFFLDYEVVLASNFQELLDLSAKAPKEPFATVSAKFQEIRAKAGTQPVGQYVANNFIRRRLADLTQEAPYHFSARMLATQGAGNRPIQVPRGVLVSELRRAIAPMDWMMVPMDQFNMSLDNAMLEKINHTFENCRGRVDGLDRYVTKEDRELYTRVKEMVGSIRGLERAAHSRIGEIAVIDARTLLTGNYEGVLKALAEPVGEADAVTAPTP